MSPPPPNSAQFMASAIRNGNTMRNGGAVDDRETFHKFFECWLSEQNQKLQELLCASKDHHQRRHPHPNGTNNHAAAATGGDQSNHREHDESGGDQGLSRLIDGVVEHYETYYRAKSRWAKQDVLSMLTPPWRSSLEDAFLWVGGWRPSMAFHLLYSKSGLQLEAQLAQLIRGLSTGDLADLSASQLGRVDELHRKTIAEEKEISEMMATQQETVADTSMVELSHTVTEMIHNDGNGGGGGRGLDEERVESTLAPKEEGLEEILGKADGLRMRTLKSILEILSPIQAVHFLIAAAALHLRLHEWGKKKDARQGQGQGLH